MTKEELNYNELHYSLFDSSKFTKEEQELENEIKEFLFTLGNKCINKDAVNRLFVECNELYDKIGLLATDQGTGTLCAYTQRSRSL